MTDATTAARLKRNDAARIVVTERRARVDAKGRRQGREDREGLQGRIIRWLVRQLEKAKNLRTAAI